MSNFFDSTVNKQPDNSASAITSGNFFTPYISEPSTSEFVPPSNIESSNINELEDIDDGVEVEVGDYSANDLKDERFYKPIEKYMQIRYGIDKVRNWSQDKIIRKYLNTMRGFSGGQSWIALNELAFINGFDSEDEKDKKDLASVGEAYTIFEGMDSLFSGGTSGWEKADILWDYGRHAIFDPVNLVSFGIGKFFASGGTKIATRLAQKEAMKVYRKTLAKVGDVKKAEKAAEKTWAKVFKSASVDARKNLVQKRAHQNQTKGWRNFSETFKGDKVDINKIPLLNKAYNKPIMVNRSLAELGSVATAETVASIGTELAYQNGMIKTTDREELDKFALGIAAVGGLFAGGMYGLGQLRASRWGAGEGDRLTLPDVDIEDINKTKIDVKEKTLSNGSKVSGIETIQRQFRRGKSSSWIDKVRRGEQKRPDGNFEDEMFRIMLAGNEDYNIKGLAQIMYEQGFKWIPRKADDTISKYLTDAIRTIDPQGVKSFLRDFQEATGITMYEQPPKNTNIQRRYTNKKLEDWTPDDFANAMAAWSSNTGGDLQYLSKAREILVDKDYMPKDFTLSKVAQTMYDVGIATPPTRDKNEKIIVEGWAAKGSERLKDLGIGVEGIGRGQNRAIRSLVGSPSTSHLNLLGWSQATTLNSLTDMGLGLVFWSQGKGQQILRLGAKTDSKGRIIGRTAEENIRIGHQYWKANIQRAKHLVNHDMTAEAFKSSLRRHPELMGDLSRLEPGGVEDLDKLIKEAGFDPKMTRLGSASEDFVEGVQTIGLVKAQDIFTKSQEYVYQLDKNLRLTYDMGWKDFYNSPDVVKLMKQKEYKLVVESAVYETGRAIYGKSMRGEGALGQIAAAIEDARKIPGLGMLVPFGRFFNNTVAHSMDATGLSLMAKAINPEKHARSKKDLFIRAALGWGTINTLADIGDTYKEWGLPWDAEPDDFGVTVPLAGLTEFGEDVVAGVTGRDRSEVDFGIPLRIDFGGGTGATHSQRYNFPRSHFLGAARILSYMRGGHYNNKEIKDIIDVIGLDSLTRTLNQTVDGTGTILRKAISGDYSGMQVIDGLMKTTVAQPFSAATRIMGFANDLTGVFRGQDFKVIDRRQGSETLNNALRYVDQFVGATVGDLSNEKFSSTVGKIRGSAAKHVGVREVQMENTARLLNVIGEPNYLADKKTKMFIAGNRYNKLFHDIIEEKAGILLRSEKFKVGDTRGISRQNQTQNINTLQKIRVELWNRIKEEAQEEVKLIMLTDARESGDAALYKMMSLESKFGIPDMDKAIKNLQDDEELSDNLELFDMNLNQLMVLEAYLEGEKLRLKLM